MLSNDLPKLGGNWISAFFLAGLCIAFRNPALIEACAGFVFGSLILFYVAHALWQTHLSADAPEVNYEKMQVLLAPMVFMYGAALFYTFLEQLNLSLPDVRGMAVIVFVTVLCSPFLLGLMGPRTVPLNSPYWPRRIQQVAGWMRTNEVLMSDIPGGVAWYGQRSCVWLPLDDENEFFRVNGLKPVKGIVSDASGTTDHGHYLSANEDRSEKLGATSCWNVPSMGKCPQGFPLRKSALSGLAAGSNVPERRAVRWQERKTKP